MNLVQAIEFCQKAMAGHAKRLSVIEFDSDEYFIRLRAISLLVEMLEEIYEIKVGNTSPVYFNEKVEKYSRLVDRLLTSL